MIKKFIDFPKTAKFYKVVARKESLLVLNIISSYITGKKEHKKTIGISHSFNHFMYLNGEIYFDLMEIERLKNKTLNLIKKGS